jgi:hypothetical protein
MVFLTAHEATSLKGSVSLESVQGDSLHQVSRDQVKVTKTVAAPSQGAVLITTAHVSALAHTHARKHTSITVIHAI